MHVRANGAVVSVTDGDNAHAKAYENLVPLCVPGHPSRARGLLPEGSGAGRQFQCVLHLGCELKAAVRWIVKPVGWRSDMRALIKVVAVSVLISFGLTAARAEDGWNCGNWQSDSTGKCERVRTCTRTDCDDIQRLETCKKRTRTECENPKPLPPKPAPKATGVAPPVGDLPATVEPRRRPAKRKPASGGPSGGVNPNN